MQRFTYIYYTVKILSDIEQENSRSGSHRKVAVEEIWLRSINMQSMMSVIIYMNESRVNAKVNQND